jgi:hypothetical protein
MMNHRDDFAERMARWQQRREEFCRASLSPRAVYEFNQLLAEYGRLSQEPLLDKMLHFAEAVHASHPWITTIPTAKQKQLNDALEGLVKAMEGQLRFAPVTLELLKALDVARETLK